MPRPQAPEMEIGELVALALNGLAQIVRHMPVRIHVEQDRAGVPDQAVRPAGDDDSADDARKRVHPEPAEGAGEHKPTITRTDTAASAMTWITAARMLLSRCADPCACSCSSKTTG